MSAPNSAEGEALLSAVQNLTKVVDALRKTIEDDYPKRRELEQKYTTKTVAKRRLRQTAFVLVAAIIASYFLSISTASYCFLQSNPKDRFYCHIMPGYSASQDRAEHFRKKIAEQEARIKRLEHIKR